MANSLLDQLNTEQRAAAEHTEGPMMVIAGAGSGKTRVLTYRIAHLIQNNINPFNILALTFTNKAAREMKDRITKIVGHDARNVWMGTFHAIFARILRIESENLGYPSNFTIYDTDDAKSLIRTIVKEQQLDPKVYKANHILSRISSAKNNLINAQAYLDNQDIQLQDKTAGKPLIGHIYKIYSQRCFKAAAMDFDDLLFNTNILLHRFPPILYKYQQRFRYILVDEYQDTNYSQYLIIKQLAANNENICVVGDDAQSIYAFRGANIQNILNFTKDYNDAVTYKLEQNYRSTKTIVNAANSVILNNTEQIEKKVWTNNDQGNNIQLIKAASDNEEGLLVANHIFEQKMNHQLHNDEFAILYRTNSQSRSLEEALRKLNIPYRIYGGLSFYARKEIKDLLAYFRCAINPHDEEALKRIINYPARGIGQTTIQKLIVAANNIGQSLWDTLSGDNLTQHGINKPTANKLSTFTTLIRSYSAQLKSKNAFELAKHIASSSTLLKDLYDDKTPEGVNRHENIEELLNAIKDFTEKPRDPEEFVDQPMQYRTLDEFMQDVALLTDADKQDPEDTDRVALMTIHAAKGLEFPYVYLVGMEENLFPSLQSVTSRPDLEEERRLFYVAVTRAEKQLILSYAQTRYRWGNLTLCEPSRFLDEIDDQYIDYHQRTTTHNAGKRRQGTHMKSEGSVFAKPQNLRKVSTVTAHTPEGYDQASTQKLSPGTTVEHLKFGRGTIAEISGIGVNQKASIDFEKAGRKQLLLKFARLKIID